MALTALKNSFTGKALGLAGLASVAAMTPLSGTFAQDVQPEAAQQMDVSYRSVANRDAGRAAIEWSLENPGVSVAVYLGTESQITPTQIQDVLGREFAGAGIQDVSFFFEQNDTPSTAVAYYYAGAADGPFLLNQARPEAVRSAEQYLFQQSHPELAYGYGN